MNEISNMLRDARLSKNLGIQQVSEDTKIRVHILKDIEAGNLDVVPEVYMKSFLKTLAKYYKIQLDSLDSKNNTDITSKQENKIEKKNSEAIIEPKSGSKSRPKDPAIAEFAAQFKKSNVQKARKVKKVNKVSLSNYIIYGILFIAIVAAIIITVMSLLQDDKEKKDIINNATDNDTIKIETKKEDLLSYFQNSDSLSLKAIAKDTAWLRLIIDDKKYVEELMRPGDSKEWFALEQFVIDVGNVGAISFFRNGEQLPMLGKPGTVAKNIKITRDNVINISSLQPKDTSNVIKKPKIRKKKVEETKSPPPIIESTIQEEDNLLKRR